MRLFSQPNTVNSVFFSFFYLMVELICAYSGVLGRPKSSKSGNMMQWFLYCFVVDDFIRRFRIPTEFLSASDHVNKRGIPTRKVNETQSLGDTYF